MHMCVYFPYTSTYIHIHVHIEGKNSIYIEFLFSIYYKECTIATKEDSGKRKTNT